MYKSILITGGAGFIGSHVVDLFSSTFKNSKIIVADIFDYCSSIKNLEKAQSNGNVIIEKVDICNIEQVTRVFKDHQIDAVVHLAAQSHVDRSFGNSLAFTHVNVCGTHVLLEVAREQWLPQEMHLKRFLHISTDETYGTCSGGAHEEETSLLNPTNPYSASKAAAEMYVHAYGHSYKIPTIISRSNNIYGPRQYPEKVIPKFIMRLQNGLLPRLQGNGNQQRTFLFATDVSQALLILFQRGKVGHVYNIGSENEITIKSLASVLTKKIQPEKIVDEQTFCEDEDRPFNDQRYHLNIKKFTEEFQWKPQVVFEDGLQQTIEWYKNLPGNYWECLPDDLLI